MRADKGGQMKKIIIIILAVLMFCGAAIANKMPYPIWPIWMSQISKNVNSGCFPLEFPVTF
jgi:hypothetical protein